MLDEPLAAERHARTPRAGSGGRSSNRSPGCGARRSQLACGSMYGTTSTTSVSSASGIPIGFPSSIGPSGSNSSSGPNTSPDSRAMANWRRISSRFIVASNTRSPGSSPSDQLLGAAPHLVHLDVIGVAVVAVPVVDGEHVGRLLAEHRRRGGRPPRRGRPARTSGRGRSGPSRSCPSRCSRGTRRGRHRALPPTAWSRASAIGERSRPRRGRRAARRARRRWRPRAPRDGPRRGPGPSTRRWRSLRRRGGRGTRPGCPSGLPHGARREQRVDAIGRRCPNRSSTSVVC